MTIKSDDVKGREKAYEAIVKGENIPKPGMPESFKVLLKEFQALGLDVEMLDENQQVTEMTSDIESDKMVEFAREISGERTDDVEQAEYEDIVDQDHMNIVHEDDIDQL